MRVILAEKPSMGSMIAAALGLKNKSRGYITGTDPQGNETVCTWGIGHLVEAAEPEKYTKEWESWSWSTLPMIPSTWKYQVISKTKDQFDVIKAQLAKATEIVVATDAGREGELIAALILDKAGCKAKTQLRLWTKSLTDEAVQEAYAKMKPWSAYKGLRDAAYGRSKADWLVGMTGSRAMTLRARDMGRKERGAWPIGRVMTPTLAILVDRELEIRNFKSKDYFVVEATFGHAAGTYKGKWITGEKDSFETAEEARALVSALKDRPAKVAKFDTREVRKAPEQYYDLTTIQKEANKRFGFSSEKTLDVAQELYELKVLSYPRTGSRYLTKADAIKVPNWLKTLAKLPDYAGFVGEITNTTLGKRFVDDDHVEDHTALMPTEIAPDWASLSPDQKRIYDLVARRFLASFFSDRIEAKTVLITHILAEAGPEAFKTTGTAVLDLGWSRVDTPAQSKAKKKAKAGETSEEDSEEPLSLSGAPVAVGDGVAVKSLGSEAKKTNPPKRMTEADLLAAMQSAGKDLDEEELRAAMKDCAGIGTPATRAATIEKLLDKGSPKYPKIPLVSREAKFLVPSEKGIDLILMLPFKDLRSAELTGRWESELEAVAKGKTPLEAFVSKIEQYTRDMTTALRGAGPSDGAAMPTHEPRQPASIMPEPCPKCGSPVSLKSWEGKFYTRCNNSKACYFGYDANEKGESTAKCPTCKTGRLKTTPKGDKVCADCEAWPTPGGGAKPPGVRREGGSAPEAVGECPKCHKGRLRVISGSRGYFASCSDRDGCNLSFDCDEAGHATGGICAACKGPVKLFSSGKKRCAVCDTWVNDTPRPGAPADAKPTGGVAPKEPPPAFCPGCTKSMKRIFIKAKGLWKLRCDDCNRWDPVPKAG